jgi:hypothetical protein
MRFYPGLTGAIMVALLAACSGPLTRELGSSSTKLNGLYDYGASGRDLRLSVRGTPFAPGEGEDLAKAVEAASQVQVMRAPTHATLTPGASAQRGYELAFLFSPTLTQGGDELCQGRIEEPQPAFVSPRVHVLAAFCVSGRAETEVAGEAEAMGPHDERFRNLVQQVVMALFRPDLPDTGDGNAGR